MSILIETNKGNAMTGFHTPEKLDKEQWCHSVEIHKVTDLNIVIDEYNTTEPIPYSVLEQGIKDIISNWNQKQKEV